MNFNALNKALALSKKGSNFNSKLILFSVGVLNQASRWKKINSCLHFLVSSYASNEKIKVKLKNGTALFIRNKSTADYQTLFECFGDMYDTKQEGIEYVLDGGANIGCFAANVCLQNKQIKEIICVEPNPENVKILIENTKGLPIKIIDAAMSSVSGTAKFNFKNFNTGHLEGSAGRGEGDDQTIVDTVRLQDILPATWNLNNTLLKLDIEGQEYNVFADMFEAKIFPKYVIAELHDYLHAGGEKLVQAFKNNSYDVLVEGHGDTGNVCRQILATRIV